jgi:hypothetical protein
MYSVRKTGYKREMAYDKTSQNTLNVERLD